MNSHDTHKTRVLIIGYRKFSELINAVMHEFADQADITLVESVASEKMEYHSLIEKHRPDAVASAGSNAAYLASTLTVPVTSQGVSDTDVIEALSKARNISREIHLFTYQAKNSIRSRLMPALEALLDITLIQHSYVTADEAAECFMLAQAADDMKAVVGPSYICNLAEQQQVPAILVYSKESARTLIQESIDKARRTAADSFQLQLRAALMHDPHEPLLVCDASLNLIEVNDVAQKLWRVKAGDNRLALERLNLIADSPGQDVERLVVVDGDNWYQQACAIEVNGRTLGYVFRFMPQRAYRPDSDQNVEPDVQNQFVISSPRMQNVANLARTYGLSGGAVLVEGESGTGKEHITHEIHRYSNYATGNLVAVNCGSIPNELFESELFGYVDGAFTGSRRGGHQGLIEQANNGVLYLDEVGEMPLAQQAKLLRVLQEKRIRPLGSTRELHLDFKVVAATNMDLRQAVDQGRFRDDLFYRLNVFSLKIPPLRQRREDISAIARYYLNDYRQRYRVDFNQASLLSAVLPLFECYAWPGNVRELQNFIERLVVNCAAAGMATLEHNRLREILPELFVEEKTDAASTGELKSQEEKAIINAMARFDNDKNQVADYLGISATTLWRRLKDINASNHPISKAQQ